ncbi:hypothetical protein PF008_g14091 [Phytophthora fragariae]|uniref:Uncharacterized protein n=1 Tax=Phytophthora fragariae TaxID=53985 RepID=A0A6G0RI16_9STRA|nr:hypothetical protein PF008_g14091 [Phytophthora fragariae]
MSVVSAAVGTATLWLHVYATRTYLRSEGAEATNDPFAQPHKLVPRRGGRYK